MKTLFSLVALCLSIGAHAQASQDQIEREIAGAFERSEWTKQERVAFTLSIIAHAADLGTSLASDERCVERNPILGSSPSDGALIGVKLVAIGIEAWVYSNPRFSSGTHWLGYTSAIIHGAAAYSNSRNDCY